MCRKCRTKALLTDPSQTRWVTPRFVSIDHQATGLGALHLAKHPPCANAPSAQPLQRIVGLTGGQRRSQTRSRVIDKHQPACVRKALNNSFKLQPRTFTTAAVQAALSASRSPPGRRPTVPLPGGSANDQKVRNAHLFSVSAVIVRDSSLN
jgi:hypothetical protein